MEIFKIKLNYKSGLSQEFWCQKFWCQEFSYKLSGVTYTPYINTENGKHFSQKPLFLNLDEVESIWQIDIMEV